MSLPLSSQDFINIFKPPGVKYLSAEQDDPSSGKSLILDWLSEIIINYNVDIQEPALRVKSSLRNIGVGNEELFDNLLEITRVQLNNQRANILNHILNADNQLDSLQLLFLWVVNVKYRLNYSYNLLNLLPEQKELIERASNAIFQQIANCDDIRKIISSFYEQGLFHPYSKISQSHLHEASEILKHIDLVDELAELIIGLTKNKITMHIKSECSNNWNSSLLNQLLDWIDNDLYSKLQMIVPTGKFDGELLKDVVKNQLVELRITESFDIVLDYPESEVAFKELRECLSTEEQKGRLVDAFIQFCRKRLLHAGVNTTDIIKCYISTIRSFLIVDHRGVLLDKVCRPIRSYLKERDDTIQCIVFALLDTTPDNKLIELAIELRKGGTKKEQHHESERDLNWVPDPVDALPDFRKGMVEDAVESLISIFDTKDAFLEELIKVFSLQLLNITNYDVREVYVKLKLLKSRFGTSEFSSLDVMLKDLIQSRYIDRALNHSTVHSSIISHLFWPELPREKFKLPDDISKHLTTFEEAYGHKKKGRKLTLFPSLGLVDIDIVLKDRTLNFQVSPDKASILYLFQMGEEGCQLKLGIVCMKLQMSLKLVSEGLAFWVKNGVLEECGLNTYAVIESL